ncbi:MAG: hypothetical protein KGY74_05260, partial [Candidatus Cloacimonetes bacterium]|nr:hypothetical protein [Candidatus Cloacimonadota bacterium]
MIEYFSYYKVTRPAYDPDYYYRTNIDPIYAKKFKRKPREISGIDFHSIEGRTCELTFVPTDEDIENIFEKAGKFAYTDFYDCVFGIQVNGNLEYYYVKDRKYIKKDNLITIEGENLIGLLLALADKSKIYEVQNTETDPTDFLVSLIEEIFQEALNNFNFNSALVQSVV